jgi:hypothetical protein
MARLSCDLPNAHLQIISNQEHLRFVRIWYHFAFTNRLIKIRDRQLGEVDVEDIIGLLKCWLRHIGLFLIILD